MLTCAISPSRLCVLDGHVDMASRTYCTKNEYVSSPVESSQEALASISLPVPGGGGALKVKSIADVCIIGL